jgi:hypothetical protein
MMISARLAWAEERKNAYVSSYLTRYLHSEGLGKDEEVKSE